MVIRAVNRPLSIGPYTLWVLLLRIQFQNQSPGLAVIMNGLHAGGPGSDPVVVHFVFLIVKMRIIFLIHQ